jgi:hypothetical protein
MLKELRQRSQKRKKLLAQTVSYAVTCAGLMKMYLWSISDCVFERQLMQYVTLP